MSEKRLDDVTWARKWSAYMPRGRRDETLIALRDDHHQTREDREALAAALREASIYLFPEGPCWCGPGCAPDAPNERCVRFRALLSEVAP